MPARVLQFEKLRALTIMLEWRGQWVAYLTMNSQNLFSRNKILSNAFNSHMFWRIVINNFFVSFEFIGGSYNPSQNTLRLINEFEKCIPSFMESLTANFIRFCSAIAKIFYSCKRDWALEYVCTQFRDFNKTFPFSKSFDNSWCNSYIPFVVIMT